jgi:hypothetical protein
MPPKDTDVKSVWDGFMTKFRDIVFIILFLITSAGWIVTSTATKTKTKLVLEQNTQAINELKSEMKEVNESIKNQAELNGQIIQYMKGH